LGPGLETSGGSAANTLAGIAQLGGKAAFIGEDSGSFHLSRQPWTSTRTRAEVVAELRAAQQRGEVAALTCEDSGSAYLARNGRVGATPQVYAGPSIGAERAAEQAASPQVASR
jgi:hypothetical protein